MLSLPACLRVLVEINKMSSEAGKNFTCMLHTWVLGRDLAVTCEMLMRTSSWQTDLGLEADDLFEGSIVSRSVQASTPGLSYCFSLLLHCRGTVRTIPDLKSRMTSQFVQVFTMTKSITLQSQSMETPPSLPPAFWCWVAASSRQNLTFSH